MIFELESALRKIQTRNRLCKQGDNQIFDIPLQMSIPYVLELSFFVFMIFVKNYNVVTTVSIQTVRGGFGVDVSLLWTCRYCVRFRYRLYSPLEMK